MIKANIEVAIKVITGNINPGILKISTGLKTDFGITLLANSITLTPGTLSVDINEKTNDLYIHYLNIPKKTGKKHRENEIEKMISWTKRIAE